MPHFKDGQDKVYWLDSENNVRFLPEGSVQITDEEAELLRNPAPTVDQQVAELKAQLDTMERAEIMPRKTREIQLQVMIYFATTQGVTEAQLYASNPAYKGMKDVDGIAVALRAQILELT